MLNQDIYLDEALERKTDFVITAETSGNRKYQMDFTIPRRISEQDWQEIARLLKMSIKVLSKLPVDNALPTGTNYESTEVVHD